MKLPYVLFLALLFPVLSYTQTITYPGTLNLCPGATKILTASGAPGGSSFQWRKDAMSITSATLSTYEVNSAGTYDVIVTTAGGTTTYTAVVITGLTGPIADFTYSADGNCANIPITFTSNSSGISLTYAWDFGDPNSGATNISSSINPIRSFTGTPGNITQKFDVKLTVTDVNNCSADKITPINTKQIPSDTLIEAGGSKIYNNAIYFTNCTQTSVVFTFYNTYNTTKNSNTNYKIEWGNGNPDYNSSTFSNIGIPQTYTTGTYTINYTVSGNNGCNATKLYYVFVGSNPAGGINSPGNTNILCTGDAVTFPILNTTSNPPSTIYKIMFSDDNSTVTYNHPAPASITHTYLINSCNAPGSTFSASSSFSNACGTTPTTLSSIYVSDKPVAAFTTSATTTCVNSTVTLNSITTKFTTVLNGSCTSGKVVWIITPSTGFTITNGGNSPLGDDNGGSPVTSIWVGGQSSLNIKFTSPGIYTIKLRAGTGNINCGFDEMTKTVCVNAIPTASFTVGQNTGCNNLAVTTTNSSSAATCGTNTYSWTVGYSATSGCSPSISNFTYLSGNATAANPQFNFLNPGTYTIGLVNTEGNGCSSPQVTKTITVKSKPVVTLSAASSICVGNTSPTATVGACSGTISGYAWTLTGGSPATATTLTPGTINYAAPGAYTIALDVTNECGVTSVNAPITVKSIPNVTVPANQIKCAGDNSGVLNFSGSLSGTTFAWTNNATSIGLGSSGTGSSIPSFSLANSTASPVISTISVIPTAGGCAGPAGTFSITVNPKPTAPSVTSPINYCQNNTAVPLTATATGSNTLTWYNNPELSGGSATVPTPITTASGTTSYYVTQDNTFGCTSSPSTIAVSVTATVANNTISADQSICSGTSAATLTGTTPTGGNGSFTYQWQSSTNGGTTWVNASGTSSNSTYNPGAITVSTSFRRLVSSGACTQVISNSITINVDAALANTSITSSQNLCQGTATALLTGLIPSGGNGTFSITWESSPNNTNWSIIAGENGKDYQPPILNTTTYFRRKVNSGACSALSSVTITVTTAITSNVITGDQTICSGNSASTLTGTTPSGGNGSFSFQWQSSIDAGITWINASGTNVNSTYNPGAITVTTTYRRLVSSGFCTLIASNTVTVNVQPPLTNTGIGSNQDICEGNSSALLIGLLTTGGNGSNTYQWESSTNNVTWITITGATAKDYQPPVLSTTSYFRRTVSSGSCSVISSSVKLTVYKLPTAGTMSASVVNTCNGSNVSLSTSGYTGTIKKWQYNFTPTNATSWVDIIGTNANVTFNNVQQNFSVRVIVMQDGPCSNEIIGPEIPVTVSTPTVAGSTGTDATVCTNANSATISLNGQTGSVLKWETSTNSGGSWTAIANTTTTINYLNLTTTTWYRAIVQSGFCPQATSTITKITVVPTVTPSNAGVDQSLCALTTVTLNGNNPTVGTGTWSQISGPSTNILNPTLRNTQVTGLQPGQTYQFSWLITGPGACPSSNDIVQIISTPAITQASAGADILVCSFTGPIDSVSLSGNAVGNPTFETSSWSILLPNPSGSNPLVRSATNPKSAFIFDKIGQYQILQTISNGVCPSTKDTVIVNVFDKPVVGSLSASANTGCVGNSFIISSGSSFKGDILKWQYNFAYPNPITWKDTVVKNSSITFANMKQSFDVRLITVSKGIGLGCSISDTTRIPIEVVPDFSNVIDTTSLAICPGQTISIAGQLPSGAYNVFQYQWQQSKDGINGWTDIAGQTFTSLNTTPLTSTYLRRVVIVSPCSKSSSPAYVFVRPSVGNFLVSDSIGTCFPFDVTFTNLVLPSTLTTWNFGDGAFNQGDEVTHTYRSTGTFQVIMTAQYPGGCKFEATKNVRINGPSGILQYDHQAICTNNPVYFEVASVGIDSVRWNFGDGSSQITTGKTIYHTYRQAGPHVPYIELLAGPGGACRSRINGPDTILVDQVKAGFRQAITQECGVTQVAFSDTSRAFYGILSRNWFLGDGTTSSDINPLHRYVSEQTWNIREIVTGNSGCRDTVNKPLPLIVWNIPQIKTNRDSVACVGQVVPYVASVFSRDVIQSTVWTFSNGNGSTQLSAPKVFDFPGSYLVFFVASTIYNCSDTIRLPITVYPKLEIELGPDLILPTGTLLPLNSTVKNGPISNWKWTPDKDISCNNCNLPIANIKKDITYAVNAETQYGCKASDSISIKVFCQDAQVYIPNVFTPDGDGINDVLMVRSSGIRTVKSFRVFNRWGQVVFEKSNFVPNDKSSGWNGMIGGKLANPDVYVYTCEVLCENDVAYTYKGNITLVK